MTVDTDKLLHHFPVFLTCLAKAIYNTEKEYPGLQTKLSEEIQKAIGDAVEVQNEPDTFQKSAEQFAKTVNASYNLYND